MSENIQRKTIAGLIILVLILLFFAVDSTHRSPIQEMRSSETNARSQEQIPEESIRHPSTWPPVTLFTFILTIATCGLFYYTYRLWEATERAVDSAEVSKTSAISAANAAWEANKLSQETIISSQRAWVSIEKASFGKGSVVYDDRVEILLIVNLKNFGQTPALGLQLDAKAIFPESGFDFYKEKDCFLTELERLKDIGQTVFPERTNVWEFSLHQPALKIYGSTESCLVTIFVGVNYRVVGSTVRRVTALGYTTIVQIGHPVSVDTGVQLRPMPLDGETVT